MIFGNIITQGKLELENFNICSSIEDAIEGLPTLYIGWLDIKKTFPDQSILKKNINDITYWTFTRIEKRDDYEIDLDNFIKFSYKNIIKNTKYIFINPVSFTLNQLKRTIKKIKTTDGIITYFHSNNMIYMYLGEIIMGIDMNLVRYIGLSTTKFKRKIEAVSEVVLDKSEILIDYKDYLEKLDNQVKYIPLIYSIRRAHE